MVRPYRPEALSQGGCPFRVACQYCGRVGVDPGSGRRYIADPPPSRLGGEIGRRARLKIWWGQPRESSSLSPGTKLTISRRLISPLYPLTDCFAAGGSRLPAVCSTRNRQPPSATSALGGPVPENRSGTHAAPCRSADRAAATASWTGPVLSWSATGTPDRKVEADADRHCGPVNPSRHQGCHVAPSGCQARFAAG